MKNKIFPEQGWFWGVILDQTGAGRKIGSIYSTSLILPWLFTFAFTASTAVKLSMFFSTLVFIVAFFFLARMYMSDRYAFLSSLVLLTPMFDNIVSGMWYNYFALGCGLLFWIASTRFINNHSWQSYLSAVVSFAMAIYSHPVGIVLCAAILISSLTIILFFRKAYKYKLLLWYLTIPLISLLLAFPQIYTILGLDANTHNIIKDAGVADFSVTGIGETMRRLFLVRVWGGSYPTKFSIILMGLNIFSVLILCIFGLFSLSKNKDYEKLLPLISIFVITAILISRSYNLFHIHIGLLQQISTFYDRFQLLSQIFLILLCGTGLYFLARLSKQKLIKKSFLTTIYILLAVSVVSIALRTPKKIFIDRTGQLETLQGSSIYKDVSNLWTWISSNVHPERERIYFEDTYGKFSWNVSSNPESMKTHVFALTRMYTDARQVGGLCGFTTKFAQRYEQGTAFGISVDDAEFTDNFIHERMKALNSKYIVANSDDFITRLEKVSFLKRTAVFGIFQIFENTKMEPAWAYNLSTGVAARMIRHSATHFEIIAEGKQGNDIHISMAYYPNYMAQSGQTEIPVINQQSLIHIKLPVDGKQSIHFYYILNKQHALYSLFAGIFSLIVGTICIPFLFPSKEG